MSECFDPKFMAANNVISQKRNARKGLNVVNLKAKPAPSSARISLRLKRFSLLSATHAAFLFQLNAYFRSHPPLLRRFHPISHTTKNAAPRAFSETA